MEADAAHPPGAHVPWPLPVGHRYGPQGFDLRNHHGRASISEQRGLQAWQDAYRQRIKRVGFAAGYFDAVTQTAALDVQVLAGLPRTGVIDEDTFRAVWTVEPPRPEPPADAAKEARARARGRTKKIKEYWRRVSQRQEYASDGSAPRWWPGRPFGPGEYGFHVQQLQRLLQARETGKWTKELSGRVRAARRLHGLPVSDVVSLDLAVAIDPGPWE